MASESDDITVDLQTGAHSSAPTALREGDHFGPYRIERLLGRGGMGEVYEAEQLETGHRVALKLLSALLLSSDTERLRFLREGRVAASVRHPHSLYIYGTEEIDGRPVITMELARRGTLRDLVESTGPVPARQVARFGVQLAQGLAAAAAAGVLHRDIKPANCFLDNEGKVKIGDYGLSLPSGSAPRDEDQLTVNGDFLGTPAYASPEQVRGLDLDHRSDLYSLGATLYYLATGRPPFSTGRGVKLLADVLTARPEPTRALRPEIPRALDRIILRCLEKDPAKRYQNYAELERELYELASAPDAPKELWPRVAAGVLDGAFSSLAFLLVSGGVPARPDSSWLVRSTTFGYLTSLAFGIAFESIWGRTPGKAMLGLRVVTTSVDANRAFAMLKRNLAFSCGDLAGLIVLLLLFSFGQNVRPGAKPWIDMMQSIVPTLWFALLFSPARARNGWLAWHDRWSGTSVARSRSVDDTELAPSSASADEPSDAREKLGPYLVAKTPAAGTSAAIEGYDPALRRRVWIVPCEARAPHISLHRRDLDDVGRPRWVHGRRSAEGSWDAYELDAGEPFLRAIASPRGWQQVRHWLLNLAQAANRMSADAELRVPLALNRLWVTRGGRLLLLDFVPPGAQNSADALDASDITGAMDSPPAVARFVSEVARRALSPRSTLPLHASRLLVDLREGRFASMRGMVDALHEVRDRAVAPSRSLRVAQTVISLSIPIIAGAALAFGEWEAGRRYPEQVEVDRALRLHREISAGAQTSEAAAELRVTELYLAGPLRAASADTTRRALISVRLSRSQKERAELESYLRIHPAMSSDSLPIVSAEYAAIARHRLPLFTRVEPLAVARYGLAIMGLVACLAAIAGLPLALIFRGGAGFRLLGQTIVDRHGREISRARAALRWMIGALPFAFVWWVGVAGTGAGRPRGGGQALFASPWLALGGILCLVAIVWSAVDRHRIFQDHVCGTRVTLE